LLLRREEAAGNERSQPTATLRPDLCTSRRRPAPRRQRDGAERRAAANGVMRIRLVAPGIAGSGGGGGSHVFLQRRGYRQGARKRHDGCRRRRRMWTTRRRLGEGR